MSFSKILNTVSKDIDSIEEALRNKSIFFEFQMELHDGWQFKYSPDTKKILLINYDIDYQLNYQVSTALKRIEFHRYLPIFIEKLLSYGNSLFSEKEIQDTSDQILDLLINQGEK